MASLIQYNWLRERNGLRYDARNAVIEIEPERAREALKELALTLLGLQRQARYDKAKEFMAAWSGRPPELDKIVSDLDDLPRPVYPIYHVASLRVIRR